MKNSKKAWSVLVTLALIYATCNGIMGNCVGVIFAAVRSDMGFKASELSLYYSVKSVVTAVVISGLAKRFFASRRPEIMLAVFGMAASLSFAVMAIYNSVWQWYLSAVLGALGACTIAVIVPVVVNNWFSSNQGTLIGFAFMGSGLISIIFSPVFSMIIGASSWRTACVVMGALGVIGWVLPALLFFRLAPEETDADAAAGPKSAADSVTHKSSRKIPPYIFGLICAAVIIPGGFTSLTMQLPTFATTMGYSLTLGAAITSCAQVGNLLSKVLIGVMADKTGGLAAGAFFTVLVGVGLIMILAGLASPLLICAGAVFMGCAYGVAMTAPSLVFMEVYGPEEYRDRLSAMQRYFSITGIVTSFLYPFVYDATGTWSPVFVFGIIASFACASLMMWVRKALKA